MYFALAVNTHTLYLAGTKMFLLKRRTQISQEFCEVPMCKRFKKVTTIPVPSILLFAVRSLNQIKAIKHAEVLAQVLHDMLKTFERGCEMKELRLDEKPKKR